MKRAELEAYLYAHIPLSRALGIQVEKATPDQIILSAPFANNINHKKTIFGGSLHAVATLACWSLLHLNLQEIRVQIVITKSEVNFLAPVDADFKVECVLPEKMVWERFLKMLELKNKARISLTANIYHKNHLCVEYKAVFAAIC